MSDFLPKTSRITKEEKISESKKTKGTSIVPRAESKDSGVSN